MQLVSLLLVVLYVLCCAESSALPKRGMSDGDSSLHPSSLDVVKARQYQENWKRDENSRLGYWDRFKRNGKRTWEEYQNAVQSGCLEDKPALSTSGFSNQPFSFNPPPNNAPDPDGDTWYDVDGDGGVKWRVVSSRSTESKHLKKLAIDTGEYQSEGLCRDLDEMIDDESIGQYWEREDNGSHDETYGSDNESDEPQYIGPSFSSTLSPRWGTIFARTISQPYFHDLQPPNSWAEITWASWLRECQEQNISPSRLRVLATSSLGEDGDLEVIGHIFSTKPRQENAQRNTHQNTHQNAKRNELEDVWREDGGYLSVELKPGSDNFQAVMGITDIEGMVDLAQNNFNALGRREIESAWILWKVDSLHYPYARVVLEEPPEPGASG